jgi:serine phosphatase RsbU (regulator of sigma subunit)
MLKKKRSVFTILLLRIIILVIFFNIVIAILAIYEATNIQKRKIEIVHKNNQNEIAGLADSWNTILKLMDEIFHISLDYALLKIIDIHTEQDLGNVDLYKQMEISGLDTSYVDFYVIKDSIIVNTTCPSHMGIDVDSIEIIPENLLSKINEGGRCVTESWTLDFRTKRFKSRGYVATNDTNYIVIAECYSKLADELMAMFVNRVKRITNENENILAVNYYFGDPYRHFGLINDTINYKWHDSLIFQAFTDKTNIKRQISVDNKTAMADYIFTDAGNQQWFSGNSVLSVITEITDPEITLYDIVKAQIIILLSFLILIFIIFMVTTRKPRKTIKDLRLKATLIANGKRHERAIITGKNEFSAFAEQFNSMVEQLHSSQNELRQKNEVIEKNYKTLHEKNEEITIQRDEIETQRDIVTKQKDKILEQQRSITESIQYARQIQTAILPPDEVIKYLLPKHFILYRPRDIVSGDFYWLTHKHGEIIIVVADCTGHGVPGAFMSMLGCALLKDVITSTEIPKANQILNDLREKVILSLRQTGREGEAKDGMDISLCIINTEKMSLQYAGANIPLYYVRQGRLKEIKADKMPIGISSKAGNLFTNHVIKIYKNDSIYLFTDGYVDQFGGESGKKFLSKQFKELILEIQNNIMIDQKEILNQKLNEWMGLTGPYERHEQVDDITIMGIKI